MSKFENPDKGLTQAEAITMLEAGFDPTRVVELARAFQPCTWVAPRNGVGIIWDASEWVVSAGDDDPDVYETGTADEAMRQYLADHPGIQRSATLRAWQSGVDWQGEHMEHHQASSRVDWVTL